MSKNVYCYNSMNVIMNFGLFPALLTVILLFAMMIGKAKGMPVPSSILVVAVCFIASIVVFIVNLLKTRIILDDNYIEYKNLFSSIKAKWSEVRGIERKYIYSGGFPTGGPPRDLQIKLSNSKHINVHYFVLNADNANWDEDGMVEFESALKHYVPDICITP